MDSYGAGKMTKESLGINGEHAQLGREIGQAEFRGYVVASLEANKDAHEKIREEIVLMREAFEKHWKSVV